MRRGFAYIDRLGFFKDIPQLIGFRTDRRPRYGRGGKSRRWTPMALREHPVNKETVPAIPRFQPPRSNPGMGRFVNSLPSAVTIMG